MEIESIKGLPLEEQIKELKKLKEQFAKEKGALKDQIFELEDSKKQKEAFAKNLVASQKDHSAAEVSVIVSSIKNVKGVLTGKNKELQFVERAIKAAEDMLKKREQELEDEEEERQGFELLLEQLIVLYKKEEEKRHVFLEKIIDSKDNGKEKIETEKKEKEDKQLEDELEDVQTRSRRREEEQDYVTRQQQNDYMPDPAKQGGQEGNAYIPKRPDDEVYHTAEESRQLYENRNDDYVPNKAQTMENSKEFESEKDKLLKKIKHYETGR